MSTKMPRRQTPLVNEEFYHIYNRGVAKMRTFEEDRHYRRFERTIDYYTHEERSVCFSRFLRIKKTQCTPIDINPPKTQVDIIAYCLMPNHFHLIIKQCSDEGISTFMRKVGNSYTRYYNTVKNRVGPLFQGQFKAKHIESETYLLHLSRYIHLNPVQAKLVTLSNLAAYRFSSFRQYCDNTTGSYLTVKPQVIINQFSHNKNSYKQFCTNLNDFGGTITHFKDMLLDGEEL